MPCRSGIILLALLIAPPGAAAGERTVVLDPAASRITFTLDTTFHQVHGTMALAEGRLRFDPVTGAASGAVAIDARSAATGNARRDRTMHADILESGRFPAVTFRVERIEGTLTDPGRSDLRLVGVMSLHGGEHPMTLPAEVESRDGRVRGSLRFTIPYVEWGLRDPSFLMVRAKKTVAVLVEVEGRWQDDPAVPR